MAGWLLLGIAAVAFALAFLAFATLAGSWVRLIWKRSRPRS